MPKFAVMKKQADKFKNDKSKSFKDFIMNLSTGASDIRKPVGTRGLLA